jgi:hypothetical protein
MKQKYIKMKAKITCLFLLLSIFTFSQTWPKYYGEPDRNDWSRDIMETYDKGYLISGGFEDFAWLIKTDINGDTLWSKILKCDGFNWLNSIHQTSNGSILACGVIQHNEAQQMPYVLKLNSCGEIEWCKSFFTTTPNVLPWAQEIKETSSGDLIVLINCYGDYPQESMHMFKLTADGEVLWKKPVCSAYIHPEAAVPLGESFCITSEEKYLIAGSVYWKNPWSTGDTLWLRSLFVMVDSLGNEEWVLPFGLQDTIISQAFDIVELPMKKYIGVGSYIDWTSGYVQPLFIKIDCTGYQLDYRIIYSNEINPVFNEGEIGRIIRKDTLYYLCGSFRIAGTEIIPVTNFIIDTNLFLTNPEVINYFIHPENEIWNYEFDTTFNFRLLVTTIFKEQGNRDIAFSKLNTNLEYDTTYTGNFNYDSLCQSSPPQSGFIFLDDCEIITGTEIPSPEEYYSFIATIPITAYPNPAETEITLAFQNTEHHSIMLLECYNIYGQKVHSEKIWKGQQQTKLDVSNWGNGLYFAVVKSNGKVAGTGRFVRK